MSPREVVTAVTRLPSKVTPVAGVFSKMRTPRCRAPAASAMVVSVALPRPSSGYQSAPHRSSTLSGGNFSFACDGVSASARIWLARLAGALKARGKPGLSLQRREDLQAALDDLPGAERGPGLSDQARGMPGGPGGQPLALEHDHVGPAAPGEVVGDRAAGDPPADDNHPGPCGQAAAHGRPGCAAVTAGTAGWRDRSAQPSR